MTLRKLRSSNEAWLTSYADLITNLLIFFVLIISASSVETGRMEKIVQKISGETKPSSLTEAQEKVVEALEQQHLLEHVEARLTNEGLEISLNAGVTFPSGQAVILPEMEEPLAKVLATLAPYGAKYKLAVEGHTDEVPIKSGQFKSNWELSSARAMQIRERVEQAGFNPKNIRVEAYADNKAPENTTKNPENISSEDQKARRRRVVLRLY
jgi:chemotaxis protein MotB